MHHAEGFGLQHADAIEGVGPLGPGDALQSQDGRNDRVVEAGGAGGAHAPLRLQGEEDVDRSEVVGVDPDVLVFQVVEGETERRQLGGVGPLFVDRPRDRFQFPARIPASSRTYVPTISRAAPG